jgi:hypothetical protein
LLPDNDETGLLLDEEEDELGLLLDADNGLGLFLDDDPFFLLPDDES